MKARPLIDSLFEEANPIVTVMHKGEGYDNYWLDNEGRRVTVIWHPANNRYVVKAPAFMRVIMPDGEIRRPSTQKPHQWDDLLNRFVSMWQAGKLPSELGSSAPLAA